MNHYLKNTFGALFFAMLSLPVYADGGISLGATRIIYPASAQQTSLAITNSGEKERFLVNSWVENNKGEKEKAFIVTPPLFVSEPKSEHTLRIIYAGQPLPADRESIFWMNVKAIPSVDKDSLEGKNVLQLAVLSRIKLFVRPAKLPGSPETAPAQLAFSRAGNNLVITNPSPYYVTLVNVRMGTQKLDNVMVAPKNRAQVALPANLSGGVPFQTVNDYGAVTPHLTASLH